MSEQVMAIRLVRVDVGRGPDWMLDYGTSLASASAVSDAVRADRITADRFWATLCLLDFLDGVACE